MQLTLSVLEIRITVSRRRSFDGPPGLAMIREWYQRRRQRQALRELDDRLLRDVGISRATADHEAAKPFWKA